MHLRVAAFTACYIWPSIGICIGIGELSAPGAMDPLLPLEPFGIFSMQPGLPLQPIGIPLGAPDPIW